MRSHAYRALTLVLATSALVACGESVDVGTFDDGTGGAGGGDLATSGAPTSTPSSSGAAGDTTTGSGGDDTTSTSTGGADPTPDSFQIVVARAARLNLEAVLLGRFERGALQSSLDCEEVGVSGGCHYQRCTRPSVEAKNKIDAGTVSIRANGETILAAENVASDGYAASAAEPGYAPGDELIFSVSGSADVPGFTTTLVSPPPATNAQEVVDTARLGYDDDLTFDWEPTPDANTFVVSLGFANNAVDDDGPVFIQCEVAGPAGSVVIPGAFVADAIAETTTDYVSISIGRSKEVATGTFGGQVGISHLLAEAGTPCGGLANLACEDDEYCNYPNGSCGADDGMGVCHPRPEDCASDQEGPVCTCSGDNFPSACEAAQHGFDLWGGEDFCPAPVACGGFGGSECAADEFCDFRNDLCGTADESGVCRERPTSCPEPNADEVVCGCVFGDTFGSECLANQAGQDVGPGDGLECGGA